MRKGQSRDAPDIHSSTDDYARRFSGALGEWLLQVQEEATLSLTAPLKVVEALDVGGGHAQNVTVLKKIGAKINILGSDKSCSLRLQPYLHDHGSTVFTMGNLTKIPFDDRSFDLTLSYRILAHVGDWQALIRELCRVSKNAVFVDYPVWRSSNILSKLTFGLKKSLEGNTRPFRVFHEQEIIEFFSSQGFKLTGRVPQFFWPMALHRLHKQPILARGLEAVPKFTGLTALFGSPVIARFEREQERM